MYISKCKYVLIFSINLSLLLVFVHSRVLCGSLWSFAIVKICIVFFLIFIWTIMIDFDGENEYCNGNECNIYCVYYIFWIHHNLKLNILIFLSFVKKKIGEFVKLKYISENKNRNVLRTKLQDFLIKTYLKKIQTKYTVFFWFYMNFATQFRI